MRIPFIQVERDKETIRKIPLDSISTNPFQPRINFNQEEIDELALSIKNYGVIQPIIVREKEDGYELIAGERRYRACLALGLKDIPAIVKDIDDPDMAEIALVENLQRKDLSFMEEARAYQQLIENFSLTQKELAERIGKSQSTVANKLRLLNLPTDVCEQLEDENITERHARALLRLKDKDSQLALIEKIKKEKLSVKETERIIERMLEEKEEKEPRIYTVYRDLRLFINTLNNTVAEMKKTGLDVQVEQIDEEDYVEYKIILPKWKGGEGIKGVIFLAKKLAIVNQKGGVGKSTTAVNLSAALAEMGVKVLLGDIDPQGNATSGVGIDKSRLEYSIYDVLINEVDVREAILETEIENFHILPANIDLAGSEIELVSMISRESKLKNVISRVDADYDFIFFDCPPSLGLLNLNALTAADGILVPIQCEYYALEGLGQLINTFRLVQNNLNPELEIEGVLLTMYDARTNLSQQVIDEVMNYFKDKVYKTIIPRNVRLSEAPSFGQPITTYDSSSRGAQAYRDLAKEVIK